MMGFKIGFSRANYLKRKHKSRRFFLIKLLFLWMNESR